MLYVFCSYSQKPPSDGVGTRVGKACDGCVSGCCGGDAAEDVPTTTPAPASVAAAAPAPPPPPPAAPAAAPPAAPAPPATSFLEEGNPQPASAPPHSLAQSFLAEPFDIEAFYAANEDDEEVEDDDEDEKDELEQFEFDNAQGGQVSMLEIPRSYDAPSSVLEKTKKKQGRVGREDGGSSDASDASEASGSSVTDSSESTSDGPGDRYSESKLNVNPEVKHYWEEGRFQRQKQQELQAKRDQALERSKQQDETAKKWLEERRRLLRAKEMTELIFNLILDAYEPVMNKRTHLARLGLWAAACWLILILSVLLLCYLCAEANSRQQVVYMYPPGHPMYGTSNPHQTEELLEMTETEESDSTVTVDKGLRAAGQGNQSKSNQSAASSSSSGMEYPIPAPHGGKGDPSSLPGTGIMDSKFAGQREQFPSGLSQSEFNRFEKGQP